MTKTRLDWLAVPLLHSFVQKYQLTAMSPMFHAKSHRPLQVQLLFSSPMFLHWESAESLQILLPLAWVIVTFWQENTAYATCSPASPTVQKKDYMYSTTMYLSAIPMTYVKHDQLNKQLWLFSELGHPRPASSLSIPSFIWSQDDKISPSNENACS